MSGTSRCRTGVCGRGRRRCGRGPGEGLPAGGRKAGAAGCGAFGGRPPSGADQGDSAVWIAGTASIRLMTDAYTALALLALCLSHAREGRGPEVGSERKQRRCRETGCCSSGRKFHRRDSRNAAPDLSGRQMGRPGEADARRQRSRSASVPRTRRCCRRKHRGHPERDASPPWLPSLETWMLVDSSAARSLKRTQLRDSTQLSSFRQVRKSGRSRFGLRRAAVSVALELGPLLDFPDHPLRRQDVPDQPHGQSRYESDERGERADLAC